MGKPVKRVKKKKPRKTAKPPHPVPERDPSTVTLAEAQQYIEDCKVDGCDCPCCGRRVKLYGRPFNFSYAVNLVGFYRLGCENPDRVWFHVREINKSTEIVDRSFPNFLVHFGLVQEKPHVDDPMKTNSGIWRLSKAGRDFVLGKKRIPARAYTFNREFYGFGDDTVSIREVFARGKGFDYAEMMRHIPSPKVRRSLRARLKEETRAGAR